MNRLALREMLVRHEGLRLHPYRDTVGKLTVGIGRNLDDVGISREEAFFLFDNDVDRAVAGARRSLPVFDTLNDVRQNALLDLIFNLGIGGVLEFHHMLAALAAGDFAEARRQLLASEYASQVGARAIELGDLLERGT